MGGFIGVILVIGYVAGAWKFWTGFRKTNFSNSLTNRLVLSLLWPACFVGSKSYRRNFTKALKG